MKHPCFSYASHMLSLEVIKLLVLIVSLLPSPLHPSGLLSFLSLDFYQRLKKDLQFRDKATRAKELLGSLVPALLFQLHKDPEGPALSRESLQF